MLGQEKTKPLESHCLQMSSVSPVERRQHSTHCPAAQAIQPPGPASWGPEHLGWLCLEHSGGKYHSKRSLFPATTVLVTLGFSSKLYAYAGPRSAWANADNKAVTHFVPTNTLYPNSSNSHNTP